MRLRTAPAAAMLAVLSFIPATLSPTSATFAATARSPCITCLGPLGSVQAYKLALDPIDHFRRMSTNLSSHGKVEVLSIGVLYGAGDAQASWEIVKALDRFGRWSGVRFLPTVCWGSAPYECSEPAYDFTHAHYRSNLVTFVKKYVARISSSGKMLTYQHLNRQQRSLYNRYSKFHGKILSFEKKMSPYQLAALPFLAVRRYEETKTWLNYSFGVHEANVPASTIQHGLITGQEPPTTVSATPVSDINSITNILVALICHADGKRPRRVCGLPVIKKIVRHIK